MQDWQEQRKKIMGLGDDSFKKSYYPQLQQKIKELEASHQNLQTLFNSTSDSILLHSDTGYVFSLNKRAEEVFCLNDSHVHFSFFDLLPDGGDHTLFLDTWRQVMQGSEKTMECNLKRFGQADELAVQISLNKATWYGQQVLVAVVRDFSERMRYEQELIAARDKAEQSDYLKSVFLANLSHEIRTPMNAILGFTNLLADPDISSGEKESFTKIINNSGNYLLGIINDIIEMSKIETGQVTVHKKQVLLEVFMRELYDTGLLFLPEDKPVSLFLDEPPGEPVSYVWTDEVKLRQIMSNLLNNAVKFTDEGSITLGYELREDGYLCLFVKDTGIGIDARHQKYVFDRFRQVDGGSRSGVSGLGLGLAISKGYAGMLGGGLELESTKGKGSEFRLILKLADLVEEYAPTTPKTPESIFGQQHQVEHLVLLAEDNDVNYKYCEQLFRKTNYTIVRAKNGLEVLALLKEKPDICMVLMDIKMPEMNGFEALKELRKEWPDLPVIAQTAHALPEDLAELEMGGFDAFITKPFSRNELLALMQRILISVG